MHWSGYALPISTSIRCNAVAANPLAHRSSGSRKLQKIRWAARTSEPTGFCGHGSEGGSAKMRAHRMGDAGAREQNTFVAHAFAKPPRPSVAQSRRVQPVAGPWQVVGGGGGPGALSLTSKCTRRDGRHSAASHRSRQPRGRLRRSWVQSGPTEPPLHGRPLGFAPRAPPRPTSPPAEPELSHNLAQTFRTAQQPQMAA